MTPRSKIILVAVFLAAIAMISTILIRPTSDAWSAEGDLAKSRTFGFGPRGVAAQISEDETRFFRILQSPKSHLVFRHLYDTGTPEAKAFAIVGLKQTILGRADARIDDYARITTPFFTLGGCEGKDATPKDLLSALDSDFFQRYVRYLRLNR